MKNLQKNGQQTDYFNTWRYKVRFYDRKNTYNKSWIKLKNFASVQLSLFGIFVEIIFLYETNKPQAVVLQQYNNDYTISPRIKW